MSGQGTKFIVISLKSTFKMPSNRMEQVKLDKRFAIMLFILSYAFFLVPVTQLPFTTSLFSPLFFFTISSTLSTMDSSAWLSMGRLQSACFISSYSENRELQGDVTTSSSLEGKTEAVNLKTYGKLSSKMLRILVPSPEPVPPPNEWIKKKDCKESHFSTANLMLSASSDSYLVPYSKNPCAQLLPAPETSLIKFFWSKIYPILLFRSWLVTPSSMSTTTALALRSLIQEPIGRLLSFSTFLKKELRASSQTPFALFLECYSSRSSQNLQPI